jgi:hypothetical protein
MVSSLPVVLRQSNGRYRHQTKGCSPAVKGEFATIANAVQERLLLLVDLVTPADVKPTFAYLERRAKLTKGSLKDCIRRGSISKPVSIALLEAAPQLGLVGLTADWLEHDLGEPPQKGGKMPPGSPQEPRSPLEPPVGAGEPGTAGAIQAVAMKSQQAQLVTSTFGRVVDLHEVPGFHLRKVLMRMAAGLDALGHSEAAGEIYVLLVHLNELEHRPPPSATRGTNVS